MSGVFRQVSIAAAVTKHFEEQTLSHKVDGCARRTVDRARLVCTTSAQGVLSPPSILLQMNAKIYYGRHGAVAAMIPTDAMPLGAT